MYCLPMADDFWNFQAPRVLRSSKRLHRFSMNTAKATPPEPDKKPAQSEAAPVLDTSRMSAGQRAALELTEAARETGSDRSSFAGGLFMGRIDLHHLYPFPEQTVEDR